MDKCHPLLAVLWELSAANHLQLDFSTLLMRFNTTFPLYILTRLADMHVFSKATKRGRLQLWFKVKIGTFVQVYDYLSL